MTNYHVESSIEPSNIRSNSNKKFDINRIELYVIRFDRNSIKFDNSIGALDKAKVNSYAATIIIKEGPMIAHSGTISRRRLLLSQELGFIVARASRSNPALFLLLEWL
jgi:hypothetical protein